MKKNKLVLTALAAAMLVSPMAKVGAEEANPVQNQENAKDVYKVTVNYKLGETVLKTETQFIKKGEKLNLDPSTLNKDGKVYKFKANFVIPVINQDGVVIDVPVTETIKATEILNNAITRYKVNVIYKLGDTPLTSVPALVEKDKEVEVSDFEKERKTYHVPNDYKKVKATVNNQIVIVPVQEIEKDKSKTEEDLHVHVSYTLKGQEIKKEYKLLKKDSRFVADLTELNKGEKKYEVSKDFKAPDVIMENQLVTVPVEEKKDEEKSNKGQENKQPEQKQEENKQEENKQDGSKVSDALGKLKEEDIKSPLNPEVVDEIKSIVKETPKDGENKEVQALDNNKQNTNDENKKANPKNEIRNTKTGIAATGIGSGLLGLGGIILSIFKKRK